MAIGQRVARGALDARYDLAGRDLLARCSDWADVVVSTPAGEVETLAARSAGAGEQRLTLVATAPSDSDQSGVLFGLYRATFDSMARDGPVKPIAAGYALFGAARAFVLSCGASVQGFTLDPSTSELLLTTGAFAVPRTAPAIAVDASRSRVWPRPVKRYIEECLAGTEGVRGRDFGFRWSDSFVAELHAVLTKGGVFLDPTDGREAARRGGRSTLVEIAPAAFLLEQAGGRASTGEGAALAPSRFAARLRSPFYFGAADEIERIERYHRDEPLDAFDSPLFGARGLFRGSA
jgi:fructose-1,6-bisphosphatase I/sedoheptulose-1,7-bisphosphatase